MATKKESEPSKRIGTDLLFPDRLRFCARKVGTGQKLASIAGIPRSTFSDYVSGKTEPPRDKLIEIAKISGVSVAWLVSGEGSPELSAKEYEKAHPYHFVVIPLLHPGAGATGKIERMEGSSAHFSFHRYWLETQANLVITDLFAIPMLDAGMEPTILPADQLLCSASPHHLIPAEGGVFVLSFRQQLLVRRLSIPRPGTLRLIADNPAFASHDIATGQCVILARAIMTHRWKLL